ncbi:tautomerase family protein [Pseudomonas gingeri]|uniref:tautomerase family protein n=1 Tax=Pseudomonas gingeri TaxID=117681 RepID=UPI00159F8C89|nr:tautomerase family protein [Pseudomonas gingeri]NWE34216.1 tautomerase family protein [Pseudomonas gingeri]
MPLIYVNSPQGTFSTESRDQLAQALTVAALESEGLPVTPFVKSTVWIYFNDYPKSHVYHGGKTGGVNVISLELNAFQGGFDSESKATLIRRFTAIIRQHAGIADTDLAPVYIVMRDVPASNWGVFGERISLDDLRSPPIGATPI